MGRTNTWPAATKRGAQVHLNWPASARRSIIRPRDARSRPLWPISRSAGRAPVRIQILPSQAWRRFASRPARARLAAGLCELRNDQLAARSLARSPAVRHQKEVRAIWLAGRARACWTDLGACAGGAGGVERRPAMIFGPGGPGLNGRLGGRPAHELAFRLGRAPARELKSSSAQRPSLAPIARLREAAKTWSQWRARNSSRPAHQIPSARWASNTRRARSRLDTWRRMRHLAGAREFAPCVAGRPGYLYCACSIVFIRPLSR